MNEHKLLCAKPSRPAQKAVLRGMGSVVVIGQTSKNVRLREFYVTKSATTMQSAWDIVGKLLGGALDDARRQHATGKR